MKNLILLVIVSLFILPSVGFAGGKLQVERTEFDLRSATAITPCDDGDNVSIYGYVIDMIGVENGGVGVKVPEATISLLGDRYAAETKTDINGGYKFCGLTEQNYVLGAYREGFGAGKFQIVNFREDINNNPDGFLADIYLWHATDDKGSIRGKIIGDNVKGIRVRIRSKRNKYKGYQAPFITSRNGNFEFDNLKEGVYNFTAWQGKRKHMRTIKLNRNLTYFLYIDW